MIFAGSFIKKFPSLFPAQINLEAWDIISNLAPIVEKFIDSLNEDFKNSEGIAIHKTAIVEKGAIIKAPAVIHANCFIGANACLRGGVYLAENVTVGIGCEIKSSIIFDNSSIAHFNFIGDSIIGSRVNFEAGAVIANHYNELADKKIVVYYRSKIIETHVEKFGALVGDECKVGANSVLSPGTILEAGTVVKRLQLIDQKKL